MKSEKWKVESGKWKVESGKWKVEKQKRASRVRLALFCLKRDKRCLNKGKNEQKVSNNGNKNYFFLLFICLTMTTPNKITDIKRRGPVQT